MTKLRIVNVGMGGFLPGLKKSHTPFAHLDWRPPAQGDPELLEILFQMTVLHRNEAGESLIDAANALALERICNGHPVLRRVLPAHECLPELTPHTLLHAGPPISWNAMCDPMRGSIIGALKYEGLAASDAQAVALMDAGKIFYGPTQPHNLVAPMTGVVSYSMPLLVVKNENYGTVAYSPLNEGTGQVLRFGVSGDAVIAHLKWLEKVLAPSLDMALQKLGGINVKNIMSQALSMGDELHQRNYAGGYAFYKSVCMELAESAPDRQAEQAFMHFLTRGSDQFFLNIAMAACRSMIDPAKNIPYSTIVTNISRNGVEYGIQVSSMGDQWFLAPSNKVKGFYFPGYTDEDANLDMGDSSIVECCGLGGFAMGTSPAVARFVGVGSFMEALRYSQEMALICVGHNPDLPMPNLDFSGVPTGIDIARVVSTGILPVVNSAVVHKHAGIGQVGAGHTRVPMETMHKALRAYAATYCRPPQAP